MKIRNAISKLCSLWRESKTEAGVGGGGGGEARNNSFSENSEYILNECSPIYFAFFIIISLCDFLKGFEIL